MASPAAAAERARCHIWQHFFHPDTRMFYDFAWADQGFGLLPTPAEIDRDFPNAAGWNTGMENPALNAGQYLAGVVLHHQLDPDPEVAEEARQLFGGLQRLFEVARDPGFLPRGVALDGASHYTNSSIDQYTMVFYGLFQYHQSPISTDEEKQAIQQIWHNILARWERDGWEDRREDGQKAFYGDIGAIATGRSCRLLAALLGGWVLTGDEHWRDLYQQKLEERDFARLQTDLPPLRSALYVFDQDQVAWRLLADLEDTPRIRAEYQTRLAETAAPVQQEVLRYLHFDPAAHQQHREASDWDWRQACVSPDQGENHGGEFNNRFRERAPADPYEHHHVQGPFEAAHILLLSGDDESLAFLRPHLEPLFAAYPYEDLVLSWSIYETEWNYWLAESAGLL